MRDCLFHSRLHTGASSLHFPDSRHILTSVPLSSNPRLQLYRAAEPKVVEANWTVPFAGLLKVPQSIARGREGKKGGKISFWVALHCIGLHFCRIKFSIENF